MLLKWRGGEGGGTGKKSGDFSPSGEGLIPGGINTRGVAARTLSGEPAVPEIIPGGIASCPMLGRSSSDP